MSTQIDDVRGRRRSAPCRPLLVVLMTILAMLGIVANVAVA